MQTLIIVVHVIAALAIVGLVLLQQGKGADAGASFGAGASQTVFGASGSGNFLGKSNHNLSCNILCDKFVFSNLCKNQAGTGTTVGLPIVNQEILEETNASRSGGIGRHAILRG